VGVEDSDEQLALDAERAVKAEHAEPRHRIDDIDGGRHMPRRPEPLARSA